MPSGLPFGTRQRRENRGVRRAGGKTTSRVRYFAPLIPLLVTLPVPAEETVSADALHALQSEVRSLRVLRFLEIDKRQMEALLPILEKSDVLRRRFEEEGKQLLEEQARAFEAFKREDLADRGFTPEVERAAGQAEGKAKGLSRRRADAIALLAAEAEALLTPTQRFLVGLVRTPQAEPLLLPAPSAKPPLPARDLLKAVERLRGARPDRRPAAAWEAAREVLAEFSKRGRVADDPAADQERIARELESLCEVDPAKVRAYAGELPARLRPLTRRETLQREMERIHGEEYGSLTPIARFLLGEGSLAAVRRRLEALTGASAGRAGDKTAQTQR